MNTSPSTRKRSSSRLGWTLTGPGRRAKGPQGEGPTRGSGGRRQRERRHPPPPRCTFPAASSSTPVGTFARCGTRPSCWRPRIEPRAGPARGSAWNERCRASPRMSASSPAGSTRASWRAEPPSDRSPSSPTRVVPFRYPTKGGTSLNSCQSPVRARRRGTNNRRGYSARRTSLRWARVACWSARRRSTAPGLATRGARGWCMDGEWTLPPRRRRMRSSPTRP
mmetsp:Transcript_1923/g.8477  ORF Transcript_1923/g.8477 Transcript_1923/m.8477 type:complete len:223 (+) Transcript_1923:849-1517(+)